jgi:hypothetical protein
MRPNIYLLLAVLASCASCGATPSKALPPPAVILTPAPPQVNLAPALTAPQDSCVAACRTWGAICEEGLVDHCVADLRVQDGCDLVSHLLEGITTSEGVERVGLPCVALETISPSHVIVRAERMRQSFPNLPRTAE